MKKIVYYLMLLSVVFAFHSCDEEDYKGMNITEDTREVELKEFTGDLTSHIVVSDAQSEVITEADMGETFYLIDNSKAAVDGRTWTITQGSQVTTSTEKLLKMSFSLPGDVNVSLTSERSSDGKTVTSEVLVPINSIPVTAGIITDPIPSEGDVINIKTGDFITFTDGSTGLPEMYDWKFEGGTPATGDAITQEIQYQTAGLYTVDYTATREDNPGEFVSDQIVKTAWINVVQRVLDIVRVVATDNKIELQYTEDLAQTDISSAIDNFSVTINTNSGATLTPGLISLSITGERTIELVFEDKMYSDDEVLVSYTPTGIIKDATLLHDAEAIMDEPCVYGHNLLLNTDMEDESVWMYNTNNDGGTANFVNESSAENAIKPYQGKYCRAIVKGAGNCSFAVIQGYEVAEGDVIEIAYEAQRAGNIGGALERRVSTWLGGGSNDAGGNWSPANQGGVGSWVTMRKTINVSADTKGKTGVLYFNFMRYAGGETQALWIDNYRVYVPNPRP